MGEFEDTIKQGDTLYDKGKYLDSIRTYLKALEIGTSDERMLGDLHFRLSQSFHEMDRKRADESVKHGKEALELHKKVSELESVIGDLLNLAYIMIDAKDEKTGEEYIQTALKEASGRPDLESEVKLTLADVYSSSKRKRNDAHKLYEEVAVTAKKENLYDAYFTAQYGIISLQKDSGDNEGAFSRSMRVLDELDSLCDTIKNKKERSAFRKSQSFLYDMASDLAMDLENVSQAIEIAERMNKE